MHKKSVFPIAGGLVVIFVLLLSGHAAATLFSETFLGGKTDTSYFDTDWNGKVEFAFDLTTWGNQATSYDRWGNPMQVETPTIDEDLFVPNAFSITDASLRFTFSSDDAFPDVVGILAAAYDGSQLLYSHIYNLGYVTGPIWNRVAHRQYADLTLDLADLGVLGYLGDGMFTSVVLTPLSDIRIDYANLTVDASPVPEPATMLLLGSGLIGITAFKKRHQRAV